MDISMKKFSAALTAAIMALTFAGCGNGSSDSSKTDNDKSSAGTAPAVTLPPKEDSEPEETGSAEAEQTENDSAGDAQEGSPYAPAMWKVTSPDGKTMYMMGSMHALKEECYPLPDYVESAYRQADVLAVECDISDTMSAVAATLKYTDRLLYTDGDTAAAHLEPGEWDDICSYLEFHGEDPANYELYQLWYLSQLMETFVMVDAELDATLGIDLYLLNDAHETGKEIYEVESAEAQMDLLVNFSDEIYSAVMMGYCAENNDDIRQEMLDLYNAWRTGDVDGIAEDSGDTDDDLSKDEKEIIAEYNKALLSDRNIGMAEAAKKLMGEDKNVFYLVGAAHFTGDDGIIALLESDGYTAERVTG